MPQFLTSFRSAILAESFRPLLLPRKTTPKQHTTNWPLWVFQFIHHGYLGRIFRNCRGRDALERRRGRGSCRYSGKQMPLVTGKNAGPPCRAPIGPTEARHDGADASEQLERMSRGLVEWFADSIRRRRSPSSRPRKRPTRRATRRPRPRTPRRRKRRLRARTRKRKRRKRRRTRRRLSTPRRLSKKVRSLPDPSRRNYRTIRAASATATPAIISPMRLHIQLTKCHADVYTECKQSKQCSAPKHHFDDCVERVQQQESEGEAKEDCVEECTYRYE